MASWPPPLPSRNSRWLSLLCLVLAACSKAPPAPDATASAGRAASAADAVTDHAAPSPQATPAAVALTVKGRIHASLPVMSFTLTEGDQPHQDGLLQVRSIDIRQDGQTGVLQRIDRLDTATPWTADAPGFELVDMNFDGYADMRLIELQPAGPNVPYLNWLFDPSKGSFVASPALNELSSPQFDARQRQIHSRWRDSAAREGVDTHEFRDGALTPVRRETREAMRPGSTRLSQWRWDGQTWVRMSTREQRDPP